MIRTQINSATDATNSVFPLNFQQECQFSVNEFCKWSTQILREKMQRDSKTISIVFIVSNRMANVMAAPFSYMFPENTYIFLSHFTIIWHCWGRVNNCENLIPRLKIWNAPNEFPCLEYSFQLISLNHANDFFPPTKIHLHRFHTHRCTVEYRYIRSWR